MSLMAVSEALARVLAQANPLPPDLKVALADAHGRVLTADVPALRTQPPASLSAMASFTWGEMASRLPVIRAEAIEPRSPLRTARMRLSIASRIPSIKME